MSYFGGCKWGYLLSVKKETEANRATMTTTLRMYTGRNIKNTELNIAETRGIVAETQRLTRVSVIGYIAVFNGIIAAL